MFQVVRLSFDRNDVLRELAPPLSVLLHLRLCPEYDGRVLVAHPRLAEGDSEMSIEEVLGGVRTGRYPPRVRTPGQAFRYAPPNLGFLVLTSTASSYAASSSTSTGAQQE